MFQKHHNNEPFDDNVNLFNQDTLFRKNLTSEEDGNDKEVCYNIYKIEIVPTQSNSYIMLIIIFYSTI